MSKDRKKERRWEYLRATGRPSRLAPGSPEVKLAASKVASFHARGMSYGAMADQIGVNRDTLSRLHREDRPGMRRTSFEAIARLRFVDDGSLSGHVPYLGAQRRLQALRADGFPYTFLNAHVGRKRNSPIFQRILTGVRGPGQPVEFIIASSARLVEQMYEKLAGADPADFGCSRHGINYSVKRAAELGYAPSGCWDLDTIDDPDAFPEWTGECGSSLGYRIHQREGIPLCDRCKAAGDGGFRFSGEKLRGLRVRHALSQHQLEQKIGISRGHMHHWESGRYAPKEEILNKLMSVLDVTFEDLFEEDA